MVPGHARLAGFQQARSRPPSSTSSAPCSANPKSSRACGKALAQNGEITEADAREALTRLDPLWDELFPAEQARIVSLLVERIDIGTDGLDVRLRMDGLTGLAREMMADLGAAA